jgi:hypothetical protein
MVFEFCCGGLGRYGDHHQHGHAVWLCFVTTAISGAQVFMVADFGQLHGAHTDLDHQSF